MRRNFPAFDSTPYQRRLRALFHGPHKLIWSSDGRHELYDLETTPDETRDVLGGRPALAARLEQHLQRTVGRLTPYQTEGESKALSEELRKRLESLGYLGN